MQINFYVLSMLKVKHISFKFKLNNKLKKWKFKKNKIHKIRLLNNKPWKNNLHSNYCYLIKSQIHNPTYSKITNTTSLQASIVILLHLWLKICIFLVKKPYRNYNLAYHLRNLLINIIYVQELYTQQKLFKQYGWKIKKLDWY